MGALERYIELKKSGKTDAEILSLLQEEGFSMTEINDAASQEAIKSAINSSDISGYQESGEGHYSENLGQDNYNYGNEKYYQQGGYYQTAPYGENFSVDTTTEIIEQIVSKKIKEITENVTSIKKEKVYLEKEIENLKERLKKIEESFDFLQRAIIGKIGEFGENSKLIQRDLENIHLTMSKMMNPMIDTYNELRNLREKTTKTKKREETDKKTF